MHVAGGYAKAVEHAKAAGLQRAANLFDKSAQLSPERHRRVRRSTRLRSCAARRGSIPCAIHTPYLINLASADPKISARLATPAATRSRGRRRAAGCASSTRISARTERASGARGSTRSAARSRRRCGTIRAGCLSGARKLRRRRKSCGRNARRARRVRARRSRHPQLGDLSRHRARVGGRLSRSIRKAGVDRFIEAAEREIGLERIVDVSFQRHAGGAGRQPRPALAHRRRAASASRVSGRCSLTGAAREDGNSRNARRPMRTTSRNMQTILAIERGTR